jgi:hypothetical protein
MDTHRQRIQGGDLDLGPVANTVAPVRNFFGMGNENSRNFQSLKSDLERMRNESLRLNSGVQTEGDAQRAWNELFQNLSDEQFVLQRMEEIQRLNEMAIAERRANVDATRMQYGYSEITDKELFPGEANRPRTGLAADVYGSGRGARRMGADAQRNQRQNAAQPAPAQGGRVRTYNPRTGRIE